LLRVMVVYLVLPAPWVASSVFTAAANRNLTLAKCHVSNAIVGMAVATVLVPRLGIVGLPLSLIVSELVTCYHFVLKDTCILIKEPYARFAIRTWGTVITAMLASLAMLGIIDSIWTSASMWRWFIDGSVAFLIASAISYVLGLTKADRWNLLTWNRPAWPSPINDVGRSARKRLALLMRAVSQRV
jgi:peptidoglycan biosynthesis protein MviN/MurJ (putative lipid II flippase)